MWTSFEKKPIKGSGISLYPDAAPVIDIEEMYTPEKISIPKNTLEKDITKTKTQTIKVSTSTENQVVDNTQKNIDLQDQEFINIDVDLITKKIQDILKSPSPFTLYKKSTELKEDFAKFINYLVKKISLWFWSESKTEILLSMYHNAKYEQIWFNNLKIYLDEAKYFDVRMYFKAVTKFDKEKQYIAKALLKLKWKVSDEEIEKYLKKFDSKMRLSQIKSYYKVLEIDKIIITDPRYLDENKIDVFLENLYFNSRDVGMLFQIFCFDTDKMKWKFKDIYEIFSDIARSYLKNVSPKTNLIYEYLESNDNKAITLEIDKHINEYTQDKKNFYRSVVSLLAWKNSIERWYFWSYIKTRMIDAYFVEVSRLFYWDKNACTNRNDWANLRWNFTYDPNTNYTLAVDEILQFKKLILELNTNIFAAFLKPLIYSIVSEKLSITRKELLKIRYLMTLVLSENYQEYKRVYNFFEDLEAFMDYNVWTLIWFNFGKIKIFMADIIIWFIWLAWLYMYSPVWVFVSTLILSISYIREHFFKFKTWIEWNIWVRPVATVVLVVSSFYWITNLDTTKLDIAKLSSSIEKVWIYKTDVVTKITLQKINESGIKKAVADILQFKNK